MELLFGILAILILLPFALGICLSALYLLWAVLGIGLIIVAQLVGPVLFVVLLPVALLRGAVKSVYNKIKGVKS